jgi:hypothetical protein
MGSEDLSGLDGVGDEMIEERRHRMSGFMIGLQEGLLSDWMVQVLYKVPGESRLSMRSHKRQLAW